MAGKVNLWSGEGGALFSQQQQSVDVLAEALPAVCRPGGLAGHDRTIYDAFVP
jgi:hypothetical protein